VALLVGPGSERNSCPEFWYSFNGRCYKYIATKMTWADAELYCRSVDSNLVSIHSLEEHNFVNVMIKSYDPTQAFTWIGLSDLHKEGSWMWSDGGNYPSSFKMLLVIPARTFITDVKLLPY
uniref:C-type lectin domain-containing protein n=1 Tax=Poecilia mexicana TaxID=48701 RepID=A0A3B3X1D3_9TELE